MVPMCSGEQWGASPSFVFTSSQGAAFLRSKIGRCKGINCGTRTTTCPFSDNKKRILVTKFLQLERTGWFSVHRVCVMWMWCGAMRACEGVQI